MDANSAEPWSEMDISDLTNEFAHGRTMAETASFLCRDEDEVRQKAMELGLVAQSPSEVPDWLSRPEAAAGRWIRCRRGRACRAPAAAGLRTVPRPLGMVCSPSPCYRSAGIPAPTSRLGT